MRTPIPLVLVMIQLGCAPTNRAVQPDRSPPVEWTPSLSVEEARALSPDEAKAIVIARAALEAHAKRAGAPAPNIMGFRVTKEANGWDVHAQYVGFFGSGRAYGAPSYFSDVLIASDWSIKRIVGGT